MDPADLNLVLLVGCGVLLLAVVSVRLSTRIGLPGLLLYLLLGLAIGEAGLGLRFEDAELTQILGNVALALILAEGGFTTDWSVIRPVAGRAAVLATVGVAVSVTVTSGLVLLLLDVDLSTALILGAVASSTDAAAVFAVLRTMPLRARLRATVEAESGFNDPPVIILVTVVTTHAATGGTIDPLQLGGQVVYQLLAGIAVGAAVAAGGVWLLRRIALPASGLYPLTTVALALLAYAVAGTVGASGLMAAYVAGLVLGNARLPHRSTAGGFVESVAWLAQMGLFVLLGLLASPSRLLEALPWALVVGGVLTLVARPLSVLVCSLPFRVPWRDQAFISWAGMRGAVPIVLATIPMSVGLPGAERVFDVVFLLVVVFTLVQGPTLPWVARRLGATEAGTPRTLHVESTALDGLDAELVEFLVPVGSQLAGVEIGELRLPDGAVASLILRDGRIFVPDHVSVLREGDRVLIAAARSHAAVIERRLQDVSERGRLARWYRALGVGERASSAP